MVGTARRQVAATLLILGVGIGAAATSFGEDQNALIEGALTIRARGNGAAPFGIASGFLASSNLGLNLGRLQEGRLPQALASGQGVKIDERYLAQAQFKLRPAGRNSLELHEVRIVYELACNTSIHYDQSKIQDHLWDGGAALWRDGEWIETPPGWQPSSEPRIDVKLEPGDGRAGRFELEYSLPHPLTISGTSTWDTPISEIALNAEEGLITYTSDSPFLGLSGSGPLGELMKGAREMMRSLSFLEVDTRTDFGADQRLSGTYDQAQGLLVGAETYVNLMGAQVVTTLSTGAFAPVLEPVKRSWIPEPDEAVTVRARVRGEKAPALRWRFTLYEVTRERGECTNCPVTAGSDPDEPDLEFDVAGSPFGEPVQLSHHSWRIETREPEREPTVKVVANDHGAWGRLKAEFLAGDEWLVADVQSTAAGGGAEDHITIPVDVAGGSNYVADIWEERQGVAPGTNSRSDVENDEKNPVKHGGDGLTLYEEYRGFRISGDFVRTRPDERDLFLLVEDGLDAKVREALAPTDLRLRFLREAEMVSKQERIVNPNSGPDKLTTQHGLRVALSSLGDSLMGRACSDENDCDCANRRSALDRKDCTGGSFDHLPARCKDRDTTGGNGTPKDTGLVAINPALLDQPEKLLTTLGHEIMHGLSVEHHGPSKVTALCTKTEGGEEWVGAAATVEGAPAGCRCREEGHNVAYAFQEHGLVSGDQRCIMSYGFKELDQNMVFGEVPGEWTLRSKLPVFRTPGITVGHLCRSRDGTDFNLDGQAGAANMGECWQQVQICDGGHR